MFPIVFLILSPDVKLEMVKNLAIQADHLNSQAILSTIDPATNRDTYNLFRLINCFKLNDREGAVQALAKLDDAFYSRPLPRRYQILVDMMRQDLKDWKDGDLHDIDRDMRRVGDDLSNAKAGVTTQKVQKDIVDKLSKLIKDEEDARDNAKKQKDQQDAQAQGGGKPIPGQGQGQGDQPAPDSIVMGGAGKGEVDEKKMRQYAETWGSLPPSRRAEVMNEFTRDLPAKYKPMIEDYFKSLNRMHGVK